MAYFPKSKTMNAPLKVLQGKFVQKCFKAVVKLRMFMFKFGRKSHKYKLECIIPLVKSEKKVWLPCENNVCCENHVKNFSCVFDAIL